MRRYVLVQLRPEGAPYTFYDDRNIELGAGDHVMVETRHGVVYGRVVRVAGDDEATPRFQTKPIVEKLFDLSEKGVPGAWVAHDRRAGT